jgi:hypothetical protein
MAITETRAVRLIVSSRGSAVAALGGYLFGVLSFYTNFFDSVLQATALLVDTLAVYAAAALCVTGAGRRIWRRAGHRRAVAGTVLAGLLLAAINYYGVRPPGLVPGPQDEACVYDVAATEGVPIPLVQGGSVTQQIRPGADRINSVSVIAGIDAQTAHPERPHPIKLQVRTKDGRINVSLSRDDIVDNAFSRFEFREPLRVRAQEILFLQVFNESGEPVSVYVKLPGPADMAGGVAGDAFVRGHAGNERGYEKTGYVLSGCVTRPGR